MSAGREEFEATLDRVCTAHGWKREGEEIHVETQGERGQRVIFDPFEFEGTELVRLSSGIGPTEHMEPIQLNTALRLNYGLPHGALALRGNQLVLVDTLMIEDPDEEEIEAVIRYLAETADHFEATLFGPDDL